MKVSGFTFLKNAHMLGYPFLESIKSILPICDEFIVNVGSSEDETLDMVKTIATPKVKIIQSQWNEQMGVKGYVYAQQKNIAHGNCTGDWAFYLEADEVIHEDDLPRIKTAMARHLADERIEALVFDFTHFYGNQMTFVWSPGWYRRAPRIIKNTIRAYSPDGLFFVVLESNKTGRYPRAALAGATVYHYGWVRREEQMDEKLRKVGKYWGGSHTGRVDYSRIDPLILREFKGSHPAVMKDWLPSDIHNVFEADPAHVLTKKEKKHRIMLKIEQIFGTDLSKKHYRLVRGC